MRRRTTRSDYDEAADPLAGLERVRRPSDRQRVARDCRHLPISSAEPARVDIGGGLW